MNAKETVQSILVGGFLLFVFLPLALGYIAYITSPDPSIEQWTNLFESAVVPWWIGLAEFSPLLLANLFLIAGWAGAEEVL